MKRPYIPPTVAPVGHLHMMQNAFANVVSLLLTGRGVPTGCSCGRFECPTLKAIHSLVKEGTERLSEQARRPERREMN